MWCIVWAVKYKEKVRRQGNGIQRKNEVCSTGYHLVHLVVTHPSHNLGYEVHDYETPSNATPQALIVISLIIQS